MKQNTNQPDQNNSIMGFTFQKTVCEVYQIRPQSKRACSLFDSNFDSVLSVKLKPVISKIFSELGLKPVACHTLENRRSTDSFNFVLEDGTTLSIRTTVDKNDKVAPRVVGQAGFDRLNENFQEIYGKKITTQEDIKHLIINSIGAVLPIFIDYLMDADHIVWVHQEETGIEYTLFDGNGTIDIDFDPSRFTFTRMFEEWVESTTLKYNGSSIAEIQVHRNRTFKFRFHLRKILSLLKKNQETNETLGITAEVAICGAFDLEYPTGFRERSSANIEYGLKPTIREAFDILPRPIKYTGKDSGSRGGNSKCSYDFLLEGGKTLSVKTNRGKMVCPPEVGQPGAETCYTYFKEYIEGDTVNEETFKRMVFEHIADIIPIYLSHLFDSDYLLRIKESDPVQGIFTYSITEKAKGAAFKWDPTKFSFSKSTIEEWNESLSVRYNGISLGEFQVHKHRDCYKFRFNYDNLLSILQ